MNNMDIPSGNVSLLSNTTYQTSGPSSSFQIKNAVPTRPEPVCYVLEIDATCTDDQTNSLLNGTALVHDYIVIDNNTKSLFPGLNLTSGTSSSGTSTGGTSGASQKSSKSGGSATVEVTRGPMVIALAVVFAAIL